MEVIRNLNLESNSGKTDQTKCKYTSFTRLEHLCSLEMNRKSSHVPLSKTICTIGPACVNVKVLENMIEAGMRIARLNFSHGSYEYHAASISLVRQAVTNVSNKRQSTLPFAIGLDTKGPEIRTGVLEGNTPEVELQKGAIVRITTDVAFSEKGSKDLIYVDYPQMCKTVCVGQHVYVNDGQISLLVKEIGKDFLICEVENSGLLSNKKCVNLAGSTLDLPNVSEKDKTDILFGVEQGIDIVFASFVRNADTVHEIRQVLGEKGRNILVVSKIESHEGIQNIDEIIEVSDGIMIARSDLGVEVSPEKVFLVQKVIIAKCNQAGKPVICATLTLDSMVKKPRPTFTESSDVANSILDGADCILLSGETANGNSPVECINTLSKIYKEVEAVMMHQQHFNELCRMGCSPLDPYDALAMSAVESSFKNKAMCIITITSTGRGANLLAKYRAACPVIAITRNKHVASQCHLRRGIFPLYIDEPPNSDWMKDTESCVRYGIEYGESCGFILKGDPIILVTKWKDESGHRKSVRLLYAK